MHIFWVKFLSTIRRDLQASRLKQSYRIRRVGWKYILKKVLYHKDPEEKNKVFLEAESNRDGWQEFKI